MTFRNRSVMTLRNRSVMKKHTLTHSLRARVTKRHILRPRTTRTTFLRDTRGGEGKAVASRSPSN